MLDIHLRLSTTDLDQIDHSLLDFIRKSGAKAIVLIHRNGSCIARKGSVSEFDANALSALIAGSYSSSSKTGKLVCDKESSVLFHQGKKGHVYNVVVDNSCILSILFDDRTTTEMVRLYSDETTKQIEAVVKKNIRPTE